MQKKLITSLKQLQKKKSFGAFNGSFSSSLKQKRNVMTRRMHVGMVNASVRRYCAIAMMTVAMVRMS